ncbi:hypothetical protein PFISCL1PPCAC_9338, partial [Pristionchus fissidentatus]
VLLVAATISASVFIEIFESPLVKLPIILPVAALNLRILNTYYQVSYCAIQIGGLLGVVSGLAWIRPQITLVLLISLACLFLIPFVMKSDIWTARGKLITVLLAAAWCFTVLVICALREFDLPGKFSASLVLFYLSGATLIGLDKMKEVSVAVAACFHFVLSILLTISHFVGEGFDEDKAFNRFLLILSILNQ